MCSPYHPKDKEEQDSSKDLKEQWEEKEGLVYSIK